MLSVSPRASRLITAERLRRPLDVARPPARPDLFLPAILTSQLMVVLDTTIVNVALPHIERSLRFSPTGLSWVLNAYVLAFGGLLLLGARAGDLRGRRQVFLAGIALFSVSSLLGGLAVSSTLLLAARALQGVGAALVAPSALALLTAAFPEGPQRTRAIGLFTTVSAGGGAVGLVAGGLLTEWLSWRWVMFVNVPIGVAVWLAGRSAIAETPRRTGRFDLAGAATSTLGVAGIVLGLVEAGSVGWTRPITLGSFAVGLVLIFVFVRIEGRVDEPILPLSLLTNPTRTTANIARGFVYAGMYGTFFFLSQFLQDVRSYSPLRSGVAFLPIPVMIFLASQLTSRFLSRRIRPKALMVSGIAVAAISLALDSRLQPGSSYLSVLGPLVLTGLGMGVAFVSLTSASLAGVQPAEAGAASGLVNVFQQVGAALGLAALVTIFGSSTGHAHLVGGAAASVHAHVVLVRGLDDAFAAAAGFALVSLLAVLLGVRTPQPRPAASARPVPALAVDSSARAEEADPTLDAA